MIPGPPGQNVVIFVACIVWQKHDMELLVKASNRVNKHSSTLLVNYHGYEQNSSKFSIFDTCQLFIQIDSNCTVFIAIKRLHICYVSRASGVSSSTSWSISRPISSVNTLSWAHPHLNRGHESCSRTSMKTFPDWMNFMSPLHVNNGRLVWLAWPGGPGNLFCWSSPVLCSSW